MQAGEGNEPPKAEGLPSSVMIAENIWGRQVLRREKTNNASTTMECTGASGQARYSYYRRSA